MGLSSPVQLFSGSSPYCLRFETPPTWRARSPYLYPPGRRWLSYNPQALSSLFVVSFDSQGYGGDVGTRLHTGSWSSLYNLDTDCTENTASNISSTAACVSVAVITWRLLSHCLEIGVFTEPFPSNGCLSADIPQYHTWSTRERHLRYERRLICGEFYLLGHNAVQSCKKSTDISKKQK
jgi:hypothetical protein